jgi:hypothetical protein
MTSRVNAAIPVVGDQPADDTSRVYIEGIVSGLLGASVVALWFLVIDTLQGRPLYTPSVLGTALFKGIPEYGTSGPIPVSGEMVVVFSWLHLLVFTLIGGIAAYLLALAETRPNVGFGIVLLFVFFQFGFIAVSMAFAEEVLQALAWPAIVAGNLLAAAAMGFYFWRRHPHLKIEP